MSTVAKPQQTPNPAPRPSGSPTAKKPASSAKNREFTLLFDKENYMWMAAGIALIFIGFLLMSGGKSADPHQFLYNEIYSFRRITLAPIVVLLGFGLEFYAIMKKPKETAQEAQQL